MATPGASGDALFDLLPASGAAQDPTPNLRCCCGREDCAFLQHSNTVLDSVEKDVHVAAKLGQVSLVLS